MAKVILEFDKFEDSEEIEIVMNASKYYLALHDLKRHYRSLYKYSDTEEEIKEGKRGLEKINEILDDLNINIDV